MTHLDSGFPLETFEHTLPANAYAIQVRDATPNEYFSALQALKSQSDMYDMRQSFQRTR